MEQTARESQTGRIFAKGKLVMSLPPTRARDVAYKLADREIDTHFTVFDNEGVWRLNHVGAVLLSTWKHDTTHEEDALLEELERERVLSVRASHPGQDPPLVDVVRPDPCPICRVHTLRACAAVQHALDLGCPGIELQKLRVAKRTQPRAST